MGDQVDLSDHLKGVRSSLWEEYTSSMLAGRNYQAKAALYGQEAENAAEDYVEMRKGFREQEGVDGYGNATTDYKYSSKSEPKKAVSDNQWYMQRAIMMSNLASMEFTKAGTLLQHIRRVEARIAKHQARQVG